jgi:hypothetical protein
MNKRLAHAVAAALLGTVPLSASALLFTGSNGTLSASADFGLTTIGTTDYLKVTLTNTGTFDALAAGDVLTALFFNVTGNPLLSRDSATVAAGSTVIDCPSGCTLPTAGDVGGEWAYANSLAGAPLGVNSGISSSGFGLFGTGDLFGGPDLSPPLSPDGANYAITSAGDNAATGNGSINAGGLIQNAAVFLLDIPVGTTLDLADISKVSFQYGTSLSETNLPGIPPGLLPEPNSLALLGIAVLGAGIVTNRRRGGREGHA